MIEINTNSCYNYFGDIMKRVGIFFVLLFLSIIPNTVNASSIEITNYNIDVNIKEDGSIDVIEHIVLSEKSQFKFRNNYLDCNGLNKILYTGMTNDLYGSDIYIPTLSKELEATDKSGNNISYSKEKTSLGYEYKFDNIDEIFVKYTFSNIIVSHKDVNEFIV